MATHVPPALGNWWYHAFFAGCAEFLRTVTDAGVEWVVAGHVHVYDRTEWNGTHFLTVPAAAHAMLSPVGQPGPGYVLLTISPEGDTARFVRLAPEPAAPP